MWNQEQIRKHEEVAEKLKKIKNHLLSYIKGNEGINECEVYQLVLDEFKERGLVAEDDSPIIAFGENASEVHHFEPEESKKLEQDTVVLIDLWAKLDQPDSPYADCTWMAYYGEEISPDIENSFNAVISARDKCLQFIEEGLSKGNLPMGKEISEVSNSYLEEEGYGEQLKHHLGHSLGFTSPHGEKENISPDSKEPLAINHGYSIEPGIYFSENYGVRTEINFYISSEKQLKVTSEVQEEIINI